MNLHMSIDVQPFLTKLGLILLGVSLMYFGKAFWLTYKEMRVEDMSEIGVVKGDEND